METNAEEVAGRASDFAGGPVGGVRVLVVDDDIGIRGSLRDILEDAGYAVTEAGNGEAALSALRESPWGCVVLLDWWMPRLDGAGVLAAVAADARLRARHAYVLVTADPRAPRASFGTMLQALGIPVVAKPFDLDDLLDVVEAAAHRVERTAA
jgi:DNA-binding NtrC family response regulator